MAECKRIADVDCTQHVRVYIHIHTRAECEARTRARSTTHARARVHACTHDDSETSPRDNGQEGEEDADEDETARRSEPKSRESFLHLCAPSVRRLTVLISIPLPSDWPIPRTNTIRDSETVFRTRTEDLRSEISEQAMVPRPVTRRPPGVRFERQRFSAKTQSFDGKNWDAIFSR